MESTQDIGPQLRKLRKERRESLEQTAKAIGVERSYLNKVELGQISPSPKLLGKLISHFSVQGNKVLDLRRRAGHIPYPLVVDHSRKEGDMADQQAIAPNPAQVNINPTVTPILFTDSTFVSSSDYGLVLDVAQTVGGQQHNVVARIGMSFDHAKKLIEIMQDHLEKNER